MISGNKSEGKLGDLYAFYTTTRRATDGRNRHQEYMSGFREVQATDTKSTLRSRGFSISTANGTRPGSR